MLLNGYCIIAYTTRSRLQNMGDYEVVIEIQKA